MLKRLVSVLLVAVLAVMTAVGPALADETTPVEIEPGVFLYELWSYFEYQSGFDWEQASDEDRIGLVCFATLDILMQDTDRSDFFYGLFYDVPFTVYLCKPANAEVFSFQIVYDDGSSRATVFARATTPDDSEWNMSLRFVPACTTDIELDLQNALDAGDIEAYHRIEQSDIIAGFSSINVNVN